MSSSSFFAPSASNSFQQPMTGLNRQYAISGENIPIWLRHSQRILAYLRYWKFYRGNHWDYAPSPGEPVITANYVKKFVDKHNNYLFGSGFSIHTHFQGRTFQQAEDALNENWEKNVLSSVCFEMGQIGGITGDCWVNVGLDEDSIFGERIKYTVIPSEFVFPIFRHNTSRTYDALLLQWPDQEVIQNNFGHLRTHVSTRSLYYTRDQVWELENGNPIGDPKKNLLGEIPFVHIPNTVVATEFWGMSDLHSIVDLNRDLNEKMTDFSDIINYHSSPLTIIYGAKANSLQKGARKIWSGLPKDARVENLEAQSDLGAGTNYLKELKNILFQLGDMSPTAFGGAEAISNTSGVALALQFAPLMEHMNVRRITYGKGIQKLNYLTLKFMELLGTFRANGSPAPYYSGVKWSSPLPRDAQIELQNMTQMHAMQLLGRVQMLRQLIHDEIAPSDLETNDAENLVEQAMEEEVRYQEALTEAQSPPMAPEPPPDSGPQPPSNPGEKPPKKNATASAESASIKAQSKSKGKAGL